MAYPQKWLPSRYRSSVGQGSSPAKRPTFYHCSTQPTSLILCRRSCPCFLIPSIVDAPALIRPNSSTCTHCPHVYSCLVSLLHSTDLNVSRKSVMCLISVSSYISPLELRQKTSLCSRNVLLVFHRTALLAVQVISDPEKFVMMEKSEVWDIEVI